MSEKQRRIPTVKDLDTVRRIHLTAVCGTGMGSLAGLLKAASYEITGSDQNVYPPMSTQLQQMGIKLHEGFAVETLAKADLVIVGNAVSRGNVELEATLESGIFCLSLPEALNLFFLRKRFSIVVTGTHGKTTTSALLTWFLETLDAQPGFFVGGILANYQRSFGFGKEDGPFVVEGDEYDSACFDKRPKLVHYPAQIAVLTSVEFDHADIYEDLQAVKIAFKNFLQTMATDSFLIAWAGDPNIREILPACKAPVQFYGLAEDFRNASEQETCGWLARDVKVGPAGTSFHLVHRGKALGQFQSPLVGKYNVRNLLAVLSVVERLNLNPLKAMPILSQFKSVLRRQEVRAKVSGVTIIDDFAHHPTAVRLTLEALRHAHPQGRLWAVFEPRTATSRRNVFQKDYAESFDAADRVILAQPFKSDALAAEKRFSSDQLAKDLVNRGKEALAMSAVDAIIQHLTVNAQAGDTIAILSNGGFGGIHQNLINSLRERKDS